MKFTQFYQRQCSCALIGAREKKSNLLKGRERFEFINFERKEKI